MIEPESVLGLSLGTRRIGFALWEGNEITDCYVKAFDESYSHGKQIKILSAIKYLIEQHSIEVIVIKSPPLHCYSKGIVKCKHALESLAKKNGIPLHYYLVTDLQDYFCKEERKNKQTFMSKVLFLHPELLPMYRREQKNKISYYLKVYEAVAAIDLYRSHQ